MLVCAHCHSEFVGTASQRFHHKYDDRVGCCSQICRSALMRKKLCKPIPDRGPCPTCDLMFKSRDPKKKFCSMKCYTSSDQFKAMLASNREKASHPSSIEKRAMCIRTGQMINCLECGAEVYSKPSAKKKYCGRSCYRAYMAKRFDRWVANPQEMALPQCFDEFMSAEELPCLIEGCDWVGRHLGGHVNRAHGIRADEFKRAVGFNISTGLVCPDLHDKLCETNAGKGSKERILAALECVGPRGIRYRSLEGREHWAKTSALLRATPGPLRDCEGCGIEFRQPTPYGRKKYCTFECRDRTYAARKHATAKKRTHDDKGQFLWA